MLGQIEGSATCSAGEPVAARAVELPDLAAQGGRRQITQGLPPGSQGRVDDGIGDRVGTGWGCRRGRGKLRRRVRAVIASTKVVSEGVSGSGRVHIDQDAGAFALVAGDLDHADVDRQLAGVVADPVDDLVGHGVEHEGGQQHDLDHPDPEALVAIAHGLGELLWTHGLEVVRIHVDPGHGRHVGGIDVVLQVGQAVRPARRGHAGPRRDHDFILVRWRKQVTFWGQRYRHDRKG